MKTDRRSAKHRPPQQDDSTEADTLDALLRRGTSANANPPDRAEGIAIGVLTHLPDGADPSVSIPVFGLTDIGARSLVRLEAERIGDQVALAFEAADPMRPIILGFVLAPSAPAVVADGQRVVIEAQSEIELRCGEASILLTADGQILLRGRYVTSHASATQRIRGGSVQIN